MERSQATYEAYDGVELRLHDGKVIRCDPLSVAEAIHFMRLLAGAVDDTRVHHEFLREFVPRIGLAETKLVALGLTIELGQEDADVEVDLAEYSELAPGTTVEEALGICEALWKAQDEGDAWEFLEKLPPLFGVDPQHAHAAEAFAAGRAFVLIFYRHLYGLASDFLRHLAAGPATQVMVLTGVTTTETWKNSTPGSTT